MLQHLNSHPTAPKRVVVLGSQGFVGSHIVQRLKKDKIEVLGISKKEVNLLNSDATEQLLGHLKPEDVLVIVSAIAPCKNNGNLMDNLKMIQAVCTALEKVSLSQVVYISSDAVYADDQHLVNEISHISPTSLHGMMHFARELMLKVTVKQVPLAILRPSLLYGFEDPHNGYGPNRFRRFIIENKNISLFGNGEEKRDHVFIEDVAEIVRLTILNRSSGVLNIATGSSHSFRETAETIKLILESSIEIEGTPRQNPITHRHFDIRASVVAFPTFKFTSFQEGTNKVLQQSILESI